MWSRLVQVRSHRHNTCPVGAWNCSTPADSPLDERVALSTFVVPLISAVWKDALTTATGSAPGFPPAPTRCAGLRPSRWLTPMRSPAADGGGGNELRIPTLALLTTVSPAGIMNHAWS